jgi:hypothetical protein
LKNYQSLGLIWGKIATVRVQGLFCKKLCTAGVQLKFIQGLAYENFKTSRTKTQMSINNRTTSFQREPIIFFRSPNQKNGRPPPHNRYFCNYHTLWLEETTLFSLAIKAIERPRKKKEGNQEPQKKQSKTEGRNPAKQRER